MSERSRGDHSPLRDFEEWWVKSGLDVYFDGDRRDIKDIAFSVYKAGMDRGMKVMVRTCRQGWSQESNVLAQQERMVDLLARIERHLARQSAPSINRGSR